MAADIGEIPSPPALNFHGPGHSLRPETSPPREEDASRETAP
jgi:hypothetical protein